MQVNREVKQITVVAMLTFFILFTLDVYKIADIPLSSIGAVHWIPELLAIFLLSNYLAKNLDSRTKWSIFCCAIAFPVLFYQSTFGALTASIFGSAMLLGFLFEDLKKIQEVKRCSENKMRN